MKDDTQDLYRQVFLSSQIGRKVLGHLLADMGFFDTNVIEAGEVAVRNYASKILVNCGIFDIKAIENVVDNLANVVIPEAKGSSDDNSQSI